MEKLTDQQRQDSVNNHLIGMSTYTDWEVCRWMSRRDWNIDETVHRCWLRLKDQGQTVTSEGVRVTLKAIRQGLSDMGYFDVL